MKNLYKITSRCPEDLNYITKAALLVSNSYPGDLYKWDLKDSKELWKIKFGNRAGVVGVEILGRQCCVKLFYDNRIKAIIRNGLGFSKAKRAYNNAVELSSRNIPAPRIMGWAQNKRFGLALIVTDLEKDSVQTDAWIEKNKITSGFVRSFALFVRSMHDAGARHIDLSPRNILVKSDNNNYKFLILDYEDARFYRKLSHKKRLMDLHHLNERAISSVPKETRQDFLKYYLGEDSGEYSKWEKSLIQIMIKNPSKYTEEYIKNNYL